MTAGQEILQTRRARDRRIHPRMEITGDGLTLGAGTILAKIARDQRGGSTLALDDERRVMALLATAYARPVKPFIVAKIALACELWNEGEKALAHIHLAHAGLPICDEERALRLFAADELLESGVTPEAMLNAQGFDSAPLALLKYSPDQPRVPAGNGRESGRWTSEDAAGPGGTNAAGSEDVGTKGTENIVEGRSSSNITVASNEKEQNYEERRKQGREADKEDVEHGRGIQLVPEGPLGLPSAGASPETEDLQLPDTDPNKLHHIFDDPRHRIDGLIAEFGSQQNAFEAVANATLDAIKAQGITGKYEIQVQIGGQVVTVKGRVYNGIVYIGTVYIP